MIRSIDMHWQVRLLFLEGGYGIHGDVRILLTKVQDDRAGWRQFRVIWDTATVVGGCRRHLIQVAAR